MVMDSGLAREMLAPRNDKGGAISLNSKMIQFAWTIFTRVSSRSITP